MKVWLINPRTEGMISTELPSFVSKEVGCFPPLGLLYVAGSLRAHTDHDLVLLDMPARDMPYEELADRIRESPPDVVGITGTTHNLAEVRRAAETIKTVAPDTTICLGGPHVEAFPEQALALPCIDFAVRGEGEVAFVKFLEAFEAGAGYDDVAGLIYRTDEEVCANPPAPLLQDLDALPYPAREFLNPSDYCYVLGKKSTFTTILTTRGCPYRCIFCSTPHGTCRLRSPKSIVDEMESCLEQGAEELHFIDDTFNIKPRRIRAVSEEILARGLKARWSFRGRVDTIDADSLRLARQAGCERIHYGIETGTDAGLEALRKQITTEQAREALALTRQAGISTVTYFIIGCPHEQERVDILRTIDFAIRINPDFAMFNVLAIYPHTELFDMAVARGLVDPGLWSDFVKNPTPDFKMRFWDEFFDAEEFGELLKLCYHKFYMRPVVVWRNLKQLGSLSELRHKAAAALAMLKGRGV
ncbi:MAG: radical SAM protein [Verrucomicrobia bacterium]|jgi:anaerobic magnesium-protoporphyrin IX monomethyl ester cyclase|nr:radical SAM protein [Verrucomicrobiota bacterium]